jgi:divalent metal cation (Fe/Co/Zn/Cd) transporter
MAALANIDPKEHSILTRRVRMLSWLTLDWLLIDGAVGMTAGITANSVALIGWGLDSAIQAAAALIIIWRFTGNRVHRQEAERFAQKVVAVSFLLLVPYIVIASIDHLVTGNAAGASWIGIILAGIDAVLMPFMGIAKKRLGGQLNSQATSGAGVQNILCAYLSVAVLVGLAANAIFGLWWADPVVALMVAVVCLQTGIRTWRGNECENEINC